MKTNRTNRFLAILRSFFSAQAIVMSFFGSVHAATQTYQDSNAANTWNATDANWDAGVVWTADNDAVFAGTGEPVTVTAVSAHNIGFNSAGYLLSGGTLTLTGTTPTITTAQDAQISSVIAGSASLAKAGPGVLTLAGVNTYTTATSVNAGTLQLGDGTANPTVNSTYAIAGPATLRLSYPASGAAAQTWTKFTGAGTLALKSAKFNDASWGEALALPATFTGTLQVEGGRVAPAAIAGLGGTTSVVVKAGAQLGLYFVTTGTLPQNFTLAGTGYGEAGYDAALRFNGTTALGGTVTLAGDTTLGTAGTTPISNGIGENTPSSLVIGNTSLGGTMELRGANTYTGTTTLFNGTLIVGSSAGASSASIYGGNIVNQLSINTTEIFRLASTGVPHTISGTVGGTTDAGGKTGIMQVVGTSTAAATLNVVAGAVINPSQLTIGDTGGMGNYNQTGGTVAVGNAGNLWVANQPAGSGSTVTITGGTFDGGTGTSVLGTRGSYTFTLGGTAAATFGILQLGHTGGTVNNPTGRILNLDGGTLTAGAINLAAGTAVMNFNGTQLNIATGSTYSAALSGTVKAGGAKLNIGASNTIFAGTLLHDSGLGAIVDGGLVKTGAGGLILTGTASYTGPTMVNAGSLSMSEISSTNDIVVASGTSLAITGSTGATIGGAVPINTLTLGTNSGSGGATLSLGNFVSGSSPLVYAADFIPQGAAASVMINLTGGTFTGPGTFPLIWSDFEDIGGDGFGVLKLGTLPRNVTANLAWNTGDQALNLVVTSFKPTYWVGNINSTWDTTTSNWTLDAVSGPYQDGDVTIFNDTAAGTGAVAVTLATTATPGSVTVNNPTRDYTISGAGTIAGTGGITKSGAGRLTLGTAGTFSGAVILNAGTLALNGGNTTAGGVTVNGGTLVLGSTTALGASTGKLTINGGVLDSTVANLVNANNNPQLWNADINFTGTQSLNLGTGPVVLTAARAVTSNANTLTVGGAISGDFPLTVAGAGNLTLGGNLGIGTAALVKNGTGTLTLGANNTFTGGTTVNAGTLSLNVANAAFDTSQLKGVVTVNSGATLAMTNLPFGWGGGVTAVNLNGGQITGSGGLGTFGIVWTLNGGTINSTSRMDFAPRNLINSAVNSVASPITSVVTATGGLMLRVDSAGASATFDVAAGTTPSGIDLQINSPITQNGGAGSIVKTGAGMLVLAGANTYTGTTTLSAGTLVVPAGQSSSEFTVADGTTLGISGALGSSFATGTLTLGTAGSTTLNVLNFGGQTLPANAPVKVATALNLNSAVTLNVSGSFAAAGVFPVISYPATGITGTGTFTLGLLPRSVVATLADNPTTKTYDLTIASVNPLFWNGNVAGGVWDANSTKNWLLSSAASTYQNGDIVVLDDNAAGTTAITLDSVVAPSSLTVNNITKPYSITGTGGITGATGLTKTGAGTLTLATANTYLGGTTVNAGTLQLGDGANNGSVAGNVVNNAALVANSPGTVTLAGVISGTGTLTKLGAGTLALTSAPTYTGATTISGGTLQVPSLVATGSILNNGTLVFNRTDTTSTKVAGVIPGTGSVAYTGPAVATSLQGQYLVDNFNTYAGGTTISNCRVNSTTNTAFGTGPITVANGGQIYGTANVALNNPVTINGLGWPESAGNLGAVRLNGGTLAGPVTMASDSRLSCYGGNGYVGGVISGNYNLSVTGNASADQMHFFGPGANTYTGTTTVAGAAGQLILGKSGGAIAIPGDLNLAATGTRLTVSTIQDNQFAPGTVLRFTAGGDSRLELKGTTQTLAGIDNTGVTAATYHAVQHSEFGAPAMVNAVSNLILNVTGSNSYTFNTAIGSLRNQGGQLTLTKNGTGTQVLVGAGVAYTGDTLVNAGTLKLQDTTAAASNIFLNDTTLELNRSVASFASRNARGYTVSGYGTLNVTGAVGGLAGGHSLLTGVVSLAGQINVLSGTFGTDGTAANWSGNTAAVYVAPGAVFAARANSIKIGTLTGAGDVCNNWNGATATGTLTIGADNGSGTYNGVIHGSVLAGPTDGLIDNGILSIAKIGSGNQTLTGVNTYAGSTTISGGTLTLGAGGSIDATSAVTIASGAIFNVSDTPGFTQATGKSMTAGHVSGSGNDLVGKYTTGGTVNVGGTGTIAHFKISSDFALTGGGNVQLDASNSAAGDNDLIETGGAISLAGTTTVTPSFNGAPDTVNPYTIMTAVGGVSGSAATALTSGLANSRYALAFDSTTTPGSVLMKVTGTGKSLVWSGAAAAEWKADVALLNWNADADYFQNLDAVTFDDTEANGAVALTSTVAPASILVNASTTAYTIGGTGGSIAGGGTLTKSGTAALTLSTANTFGGGTVLSQGTLTLTNVAGAGLGPITLGDTNTGANNLTLSANVGSGTFANPITVTNNGTGTVTITQPTNLSTLAGTLTLNRSVTINSPGSDRVGIAGKITGNLGGGSLTFSGLRTTLDNAANDFVGDVVVATGATLQCNAVGGSIPDTSSVTVTGFLKLNVTSTNETIGGLNGAGTTQNHESVGGTPTLTVGYGDKSGSFTGTLANGSGVLSLVKTGTGTQTLGGTNTFVGTTRIFGGTLAITNLSALAGSTLVRDNEGGTLDWSTLTTGTLNLGGLRGSQDLTLAGLSLNVGHASNSATNVYNGTITLTGAGLGFTKSGLGNLTLGGSVSNSYTGNTTVNTLGANGTSQGTLYLAKTGGAIAIPANTSVIFGTTTTGSANIRTLQNNQFGPGVVMKHGNATANYTRFDLVGTTQTLAGTTSGTLTTTAAGIIQNAGLNLLADGPATLTLNGDSTDVFYPVGGYVHNGWVRDTDGGANMGRALNIVKNGTGTQTFASTNVTYTGNTTVNAGTLKFHNTISLATPLITNNNANVIFNADGTNAAVVPGILAGNGTWTVDGPGTGTLFQARIILRGNGSTNTGQINVINGGKLWLDRQVNAIGDTANVDVGPAAWLYIYQNITEAIGGLSGSGNLGGADGTGNSTLKFGGGDATATFSGTIQNNASTFTLIKTGAGTQTLSGPLVSGVPTSNSSFTGNITVDGGKLVGAAVRTGNNTVFGLASNTRTFTVNAGGTLEFQAPNTFGGHNTTNVPTLVINGGTVTNADPLASNLINNGLRDVTLNNGTLTATAGNGTSTIDPTLRPGEGYGAWGLNGTVTSTGTSLISTGSLTGMAGRVLLNSGGTDTTFAVTGGTLTVSAPLQGGDGAVGGLNKTGTGKLVLSAANIYPGPTTVTAGTLELAGSLIKASAATLPSSLSVAAGATLMGNGMAEGTLAANGIVAPGSSVGTLAVGATTFGATGELAAEINSSTATADKLAITGDLVINADTKLTLTDLGAGSLTGTKLVLMTYTGTWNSIPFFGKADDSTLVVGANSFTINYNDTVSGTNAVTLTGTGSADPFASWASGYGLTGAAAAKGADPDGDGTINLVEFATNSDPTKAGSMPRVYPLVYTLGAETNKALTYTLAVRKAAVFAAAGKTQKATKDMVAYTIEGSDNLGTWNAVEVTEVTGADATAVQTALGSKLTAPPKGADWEWHTFRTDAGTPVDPSDYIRLKVQEAP